MGHRPDLHSSYGAKILWRGLGSGGGVHISQAVSDAVSGFTFSGMWSCRSMFICCSANRDWICSAGELPHSSQRTA
jgi:hypothetical protein